MRFVFALLSVAFALSMMAAAPSCEATAEPARKAPGDVVDTFVKCKSLELDTVAESVTGFDGEGIFTVNTKDGVRVTASDSACALVEVTQKKIDLLQAEQQQAAAMEQAKAAAKAEMEKAAAVKAPDEPKKKGG